MLKRLLALFSKKPSSQKTFEEKLDKLGDYDLTARVDRHGNTHFAKDEQSVRMHRSLHPGHHPTGFKRTVQEPPKRRQFEAPVRRGMSSSAQSNNGVRNDDAFLSGMMVQSAIDNSTPTRSHHVDTCHTTTHHTPSHGGYDSSPSDSGGSYDGGGGGSCD